MNLGKKAHKTDNDETNFNPMNLFTTNINDLQKTSCHFTHSYNRYTPDRNSTYKRIHKTQHTPTKSRTNLKPSLP